MKQIIKRNGTQVAYNGENILRAVEQANNSVDESKRLTYLQIQVIEESVRNHLPTVATIEQIQDLVIHNIMKQQAYEVAQAYTEYRYKQALIRKSNSTDDAILSLVEYENEEAKSENSNKNPQLIATQRDYIAGIVSKDVTRRILLPEDIQKAQDDGILHFHDADYFIQKSYNCALINLEDMLTYGTVITNTLIEPPKSLTSAANIATQIVAQVASNQYGGQTITLSHLAPFVDVSRQKHKRNIKEELHTQGIIATNEQINAIAEQRTQKEIVSAIQTIQYQLITLMTTNGQTPFVSVYMHLEEVPEGQTRNDLALLIEETLKQRLQGVKNEQGVYITPAFPKLLYVLDKSNATKDAPYYYLTELSAKCSAKRIVPDYISAKNMRLIKDGDSYPCMGCRSFLTPDRFASTKGNLANANTFKERNYYGRFNQGVVTINLVDVALSSGKDENLFWKILDDRLELCHKALRLRHERLLGTLSDVAPILWQHGAIARLKPGETIDRLLYDGYSTLSLGYAGIYEMTKYMTGQSHTEYIGHCFALRVMKYLNQVCDKWKEQENIDYSLYGTPLESTTYSFAKKLQSRFGKIKDITDHNYITNSYHVNVREPIDAFEKLEIESSFQQLSSGGAVSYVEVPNLQHNIDAVLSIIDYIYHNIMYAEINVKSDYCSNCGYDGEIQIVEKDNTLIWQCPNCNNENQNTLHVARRTCGYIGTQFWNQGRTEEIKDRVTHVSIPLKKG